MCKQGTHSADVRTLLPVSKNQIQSPNPNTLKFKGIVVIANFNLTTISTIKQLLVLKSYATEQNIEIIRIHEHRYYQKELEGTDNDTSNGCIFILVLARKNSDNAVIEIIGMYRGPRVINSLNSFERNQQKMICATSNRHPCPITPFNYNPTNISD